MGIPVSGLFRNSLNNSQSFFWKNTENIWQSFFEKSISSNCVRQMAITGERSWLLLLRQ